MKQESIWTRILNAKRHPATTATSCVLALAVAVVLLVVDLNTPANLIPPIFYGVPVVIAAWSRNHRFVWLLTCALVTFNFMVRWLGPAAVVSPAQVDQITLINRIFATGATLLTAGLVLIWTVARDRIDEQTKQTEQRSAELEQANIEVMAREEEITRQNEELQAQTEELERQSEELRVANDQLSRREKLLERLLELSRTLTSEATRSSRPQIINQLCHALVELTQGHAAAILLREQEQMRVLCHHNFGPAGATSEVIPLEKSFASLIMARLQTGFLENLDQRPDLIIPQPVEGQRFRSVLACPLLVRGRLEGAVEIYSRDRRMWTNEQIALIESIAAQASVSLDAVSLFEEVQRERQRFETVFRTMPFPVFVAEDARADLVRTNPAGATLLGVPVESNLSPNQCDFRTPLIQFFKDGKQIPDDTRPIRRVVLGGEVVRAEEFDMVLPSNRHVPVLISGSPILDSRGVVTGGVLAAVDVTVMKNLQLELETRRREAEEASVRKTHFLAAISHDIRTPVNAINLTAELIRRSAQNPALLGELPGMVEELRNNAMALGVLVHDLLDVARFDTGKLEFQETEFSLGTLLADECRQLLPLAQEKGLSLRCEDATASIWIRADRVKLSRVLANLIGNAIKFTNTGNVHASVTITPEGAVEIRVSDTGIGIPQEHLPRIFDEFNQLRNPERDRYKGTGLGLAISKRLVEAMSGTISVESVEGQGSTFRVRLPASLVVPRVSFTAAGRPAEKQGPSAALAGLRVLLVEDHQTTRWATAQILGGEGAVVLQAGDGATALARLAAEPVDVALLDMMLPDMDGVQILTRLRQERPPGLKAVFVLTGDATSERAATVRHLGANALISKPIDVTELIKTLKTVLNDRK